MRYRFRALAFVSGLASVLVFACGGSDTPAADNGSSGSPTGSTPGDGSPGPAPGDGSVAATDGATSTDGGGDGAAPATIPTPNPPAGATKCGSGPLTASAIRDACKLPVSFGPPPAPACDDTTSDGGRYEVWCSATQVYVWAEIDGLRATTSACPVGAGGFALNLNANYSFSATGTSGAGPANLRLSGTPPFTLAPKRSFAVDATSNANAATAGSMTLWITGRDSSCPFDAGSYGALVAGATVHWP
jgi:hypothetical protein